jgi:two-component system NarL family sensor kinase
LVDDEQSGSLRGNGPFPPPPATPASSTGLNRARTAGAVLIDLENQLLQKLVRLQSAETRLASLVRGKRGSVGRRAVRQIELERQRLGRELHAGVGQALAAIRIQLELIERQFPDPPAAVAQSLHNLEMLAGEAFDQVRSLSRRLYPPQWQRLSLEAALTQLCEISGVGRRFEGDISIQRLARDPDPEVKALFYRAAQEALSNMMRHARATRVDVNLETVGDRLTLTIRDNGCGFDTAQVLKGPADVGSGIGLRAIREQAATLGGKLDVRSGALGTTLEVSVGLLASD